MDALIIDGPAKLKGSVAISGSKNTALPLLFSSLLFEQEVRFRNVPRLWDIETTLKLLETMGTESSWDKVAGTISVYPKVHRKVAPYEWVSKMRAGILALGPLVAKYGEARVSLPGGCAIGARPVNFHIDALKQMGVSIEVEEGYIHAQVRDKLRGAHIEFPQVTVTGTENVMIVAAFAEGQTVLDNCACEPEVVALGEFLNSCGARISGLGTPRVVIEGTRLHAPDEPVAIPADRIETGTWIAIAVGTRSPLTLTGCDAGKLTAVIDAFRQMGAGIELGDDGRKIVVSPNDRYRPIEIETQPYPGFATDMQAQLMATLNFADGVSTIRETIFENRFMHVPEMQRLGANIEIHGHAALITGPTPLKAAPIMATDLRASASLVIAALCAEGATKISRIYHLDRGYQRLDEKLSALGARIRRISE